MHTYMYIYMHVYLYVYLYTYIFYLKWYWYKGYVCSLCSQKVIGYEYNKFKVVGTAVACVLTCGLLALLLTWKHSIRLWFTHSQCPLHQATKILCIVSGHRTTPTPRDRVLERELNLGQSFFLIWRNCISDSFFILLDFGLLRNLREKIIYNYENASL